MGIEEGDRVVFHDCHSDYDGEIGRVSQVIETMFGDARYMVEFEDGVETGVPADALVPSNARPDGIEPLQAFKPVQFDSCTLN